MPDRQLNATDVGRLVAAGNLTREQAHAVVKDANGDAIGFVAAVDREAAKAQAKRKSGRRPRREGYDAYEAALLICLDLRQTVMHVEGRGWFVRPTTTSLWHADISAELFSMVQNHPIAMNARRGTATRSILTEMQGQLSVTGAYLDEDDWVCGLPDGSILDLRDNRSRAATADDRVTMHLGCVPKDGPPRVWLRVLQETFAACEDPEGIIGYLRWWFRQSLTGDCSAEAMLFLHGPPGSGKSTIADTWLHVVGTYGVTLAAEHIVGDHGHHRQWLARLDRKRLVRINEMPARGAWRTAELLSLVSGETLEANLMRQNSFEFRSRASVCATGNHAPLAPSSSGYWRRLRQVECRSIPPTPDVHLRDKLMAEDGRILTWALSTPDTPVPTTPPEMLLAAESMRAEQDPVGEWLAASFQKDEDGCLTNEDAYSRYVTSLGPNANPISTTAFGRRLTDLFGPAENPRKVDGKAQRWRRLSLR